MEQRRLADSDLVVSAIGFGAWALGGHGYGFVNESTSIETVRKAIDLGITFFDTADVYGLGASEQVLGKALGPDRQRVVVATKFGVAWDASGNTRKDISPAYARQALESSLRRLQLDCIPLYQVHWPDDVTALPDILGALERFRDEGKIRHIGCSNFSAEQLAAARGRVVSVQYHMNVAERGREADAARCAQELGISVVAYSVLARGLMSGKFENKAEFAENDTRARDPNFHGDQFDRLSNIARMVGEIGARNGRSASQVAIRWVLDHPDVACALVGAKNVDQITENACADQWRLSADDWNTLANLKW